MSPIAAAELGLSHIVVTSVDRDDLPDGGASQFVKVIEALRRNTPSTTIEILTPDFRNKAQAAVEAIVEARPDVYNHNLETVPRLYPTIRPGARYYASLRLLESVKRHDPTIFTKSGVMVGLGEERLEVHQVMDDMRSADVDFLTMGQYLQPTPRHAKVRGVRHPAGVRGLCRDRPRQGLPAGRRVSPLTRSSYHAGDDFAKMRAAREAKLADGAVGLSMPRHTETRNLPYTPEQMFDLVADVSRYPEFLPWVAAVRVRSDSETEMVADLVGGLQGAQGDLHLAGDQAPADEIEIDYIEGPLKYLHNSWKFRAGRARAAPTSTSASTSPSSTGCSRCWPARCSTGRCGRMIGAFGDRAHALYGVGALRHQQLERAQRRLKPDAAAAEIAEILACRRRSRRDRRRAGRGRRPPSRPASCRVPPPGPAMPVIATATSASVLRQRPAPSPRRSRPRPRRTSRARPG